MAPIGRCASVSTNITQWHHFQEQILLDCASASGIWQSKADPQQMESDASEWESLLLPHVTKANSVKQVSMVASKRVCEQALLSGGERPRQWPGKKAGRVETQGCKGGVHDQGPGR
jgi:hypothetical protein